MGATEDALAGLKVFVVEDEAIIAMMLEDMLIELGCGVLGPCTSLTKALAVLAQSEKPGAAILDVNVAGTEVYPVAAALNDLGVPTVFATGYGAAGVAAAWRDRVILQKPYTQHDLVRALTAALAV